ncbi:hypothetical protein C8R44DRAFT_732461 [Mycena epipterygia]|nr:hypothetical protein C8R44DRAFT_732461 [Mycena epipterygia]
MRRGLHPATPKRMFHPIRVKRDPKPSATPCSSIGKTNMAIEFRKFGDDSLVGYVAGQGGSMTGITYSTIRSALSVAGSLYGASFCAQVNQWQVKNGITNTSTSSQDLYNIDNAHSIYVDELQNYLVNVGCTSPAYYQKHNYKWNSINIIELEWLEPLQSRTSDELKRKLQLFPKYLPSAGYIDRWLIENTPLEEFQVRREKTNYKVAAALIAM